MDYLITGASGFVGNNLVWELVRRKTSARVLTRKSSDQRPLQGLAVEHYEGDVRDAQAVDRAVEGVKTVVHCAANLHIGWKYLDNCRAVNVLGTGNVARAARKHNARLIHVSTVDALSAANDVDNPVHESTPIVSKLDCTYVKTKQEAEGAVRREVANGLNAVIVNPAFMLGPRDWKPSSGRMLQQVAKRFVPLAPSGGMSVCDVRDVVEALITITEKTECSPRYILAGHNVTYLEAWKRFAELAGTRPPRFRMGPLVRIAAGKFGDLRAQLSGVEGDLNSAVLEMSRLFHYYDSDLACRELNYQIRPMDETISDTLDWFRANGYLT